MLSSGYEQWNIAAKYLSMSATTKQVEYIGSLLYHSGLSFPSSCKVASFCQRNLSSSEASIVIACIKEKGLAAFDLLDEEGEVRPERILPRGVTVLSTSI